MTDLTGTSTEGLADTDARLARAAHHHSGPASALAAWWLRNRTEYEAGKGDERPLTGYALLASTYSGAALAAVAALTARRGRSAYPPPGELALLTAATFMLTHTITKDSVTSFARSPFTTYEAPAGPGQVTESPREGSVRHAVGELVTCPFCLSQWVGTALVAGYAAAPRATRWVATTMTVVAGSNVLQTAYAMLQDAAEG